MENVDPQFSGCMPDIKLITPLQGLRFLFASNHRAMPHAIAIRLSAYFLTLNSPLHRAMPHAVAIRLSAYFLTLNSPLSTLNSI